MDSSGDGVEKREKSIDGENSRSWFLLITAFEEMGIMGGALCSWRI